MQSLTWADILGPEKEKAYFKALMASVADDSRHHTIYPSSQNRFLAFKLTPLAKVKVLILGQDPYHGPEQAHGLSFSVPPHIQPPPSLKNIFKELAADCQIPVPRSGCLTHWAEQGVLLLNTSLSVRHGQAGSHSHLGWQLFTDTVIKAVSQHTSHVVFILWGSHAQKKAPLIDQSSHAILQAPHPSPLSAHRGFLGCRHFSKTNEYLKQHGKEPIKWADTSER